MPRVLMNFDHYKEWWVVHFIEADCQTRIGTKTRYFRLPTLEALRSFLLRCNPEDTALQSFDQGVRAWGRGSEYVQLTTEQYTKLR